MMKLNISNKNTVLFILIIGFIYKNYAQTIVSYSNLKVRDNILYNGEQIFSGLVMKTFMSNQPKSISEIKDGKINGKVIEFNEEISFVSTVYKDTTEIKRLNAQISSKKQELEQAIQDTLKASKNQNDFINYEIGGIEKLLKLKEKDAEGKLNKKKKEIYDKYEQYALTNRQCIRKYNDIQLQINNLNQQIKSESDKKTYMPKKALEYSFYNGLKDGLAIFYDSNGDKFGEGYYRNGKQNGKWVYYFSNGKKLAEGSFINGDESEKDELDIPKNGRDGIWNFYNENGNKEQESTYLNGEKNGKELMFFDNGNIKNESYLKNGKINGTNKQYYENGKIKCELNYINGKLHGFFKLYFESGVLNSKGSIDTLSNHKDKFFGDLFTYNEDGNLESHIYVNKNGALEDKMVNTSKSNEIKSKYSISEIKKPYKCKCCKSTINGLTDGVDKDGNEYTQWLFELNASAYYSLESSFKAFGFKDVYDYMRKNEYKYCSLKCSRTCY